MTEVERLNKWLETKGKSPDGKILYRLVWSDSIFENRLGTFNDFTESGLFVRQITEVRRVRKYSYIHERYIFEKWAPGNMTASRELPDAFSGDYIPVYIFEDREGKYLPPTEKSIEFILNFMNGRITKDRVLSEEEIDNKGIAHEVEKMDTHPMFATSGESRDSIGYTKGLKNVT